MKKLLLLVVLLLALCSRCKNETVDLTLPNHVAVEDIAFIHFGPDQIEPNQMNASAICRVLPSSSPRLEDHEVICFSDMEQYAVRYANGTQISCHTEQVEGTIALKVRTPILQNSCILHPLYVPVASPDQRAQVELFVQDHAALCHSSVATLQTCQSMDNRAYMDILATYGFREGMQIVTVTRPSSIKGWVFETAIDLIKHYWKLE